MKRRKKSTSTMGEKKKWLRKRVLASLLLQKEWCEAAEDRVELLVHRGFWCVIKSLLVRRREG